MIVNVSSGNMPSIVRVAAPSSRWVASIHSYMHRNLHNTTFMCHSLILSFLLLWCPSGRGWNYKNSTIIHHMMYVHSHTSPLHLHLHIYIYMSCVCTTTVCRFAKKSNIEHRYVCMAWYGTYVWISRFTGVNGEKKKVKRCHLSQYQFPLRHVYMQFYFCVNLLRSSQHRLSMHTNTLYKFDMEIQLC